MSRPSRAEENRKLLIEALVRLLKTRSVESLSVREIAAEAGINHGLVHRHFGSKAALVKAAVASLSAEIHEGDPVTGAMSGPTFAFLRRRPELALIVARACLDGHKDLLDTASPSPERLEEIVAPIRNALALFGQRTDPHVINALATSALLGWMVFRPLLDHAYHLPEAADDELAELLARLDRFMATMSLANV